MTRTRPTVLLLVALLGGAGGWFVEVWQVAVGHPAVVPPWTLAVVLALIGVIIVLYAIPVWRSTSGRSKREKPDGAVPAKRVDPFYATRVVLLAKASSLTGAILGGAAVGILFFLLTRSVVAAVESVTLAIVTAVGALVLLVGGLVAERMCTLPPDDGEGEQDHPSVAPHS
ncbi:DUF3180 domain-containing protein [Galbitalea sp. SE-J8]|uniref:DUF3180 domain-containing protein n=1 Tax=Galbitalea sp. SE-J8 TaxID=3054952 RepID=UPI00259C9F3C|nr:DUF3180 domain-containing protein [Galbitalea sp. SE-J8]MDM4761646.1 DUF3180 domain-containing protein [Galbitalea sp. SE-J8]